MLFSLLLDSSPGDKDDNYMRIFALYMSYVRVILAEAISLSFF